MGNTGRVLPLAICHLWLSHAQTLTSGESPQFVLIASQNLVASQATKTLELSYGNTRQLVQIKRLGRLLHKVRGCGRKQTSHVLVYCWLSQGARLLTSRLGKHN